MTRWLSSCGSQAPEQRLSGRGAGAEMPRCMRDPPGPGVGPVFPALAGELSRGTARDAQEVSIGAASSVYTCKARDVRGGGTFNSE